MVNHPVCAPARACLFTGQYEEKHGVWHNGLGLEPERSHPGHRAARARLFRQLHRQVASRRRKRRTPLAAARCRPNIAADSSISGKPPTPSSAPRTLTKGAIYDAAGKPIHFSGVYRDDFLTGRGVEFLRTRAKPPFLLVMSYLNTHHQNDTDDYMSAQGIGRQVPGFFRAAGSASAARLMAEPARRLLRLRRQHRQRGRPRCSARSSSRDSSTTPSSVHQRSRLPLQDPQHGVQAQPARKLDPRSSDPRGAGVRPVERSAANW